MEEGRGRDRLSIGVETYFQEVGRHHTAFQVEKWSLDQIHWVRSRDYDNLRLLSPGQEPEKPHFMAYRVEPFEVFRDEDCNLITDTGWTYIMNGFAGSAITKFVNGTTGRIGLGTSATAATYADVALNAIGALTTANWKVINAVPTVGNHTTGLILQAQFGLTEANGVAIAEFGTDLGTTSTLSTAAVGGMVTHGTSAPGTKTSAQVWNTTVTITWT
jgi:hypothetical protein